MKRLLAFAILAACAWAQTPTNFNDVRIKDDKALRFGTSDDFQIGYDELTDNRLEITDGTNLFGHVTDDGTAATFGWSGKIGAGVLAPTTTFEVGGAADASNGMLKIRPTGSDQASLMFSTRLSSPSSSNRNWLITTNTTANGDLLFRRSTSSTAAAGTTVLTLSADSTAAFAGAVTMAGLTSTTTSSFTHTQTAVDDARPVPFNMDYTLTPVSTPVGGFDYHGIDLLMTSASTNVGPDTRMYPFESQTTYTGTGNFGVLAPGYFYAQNNSSGTVDLVKLVRMWAKNTSTGTITALNGLYFENPLNSGGGTITTIHAIHLEDITTGGTNFGLYSEAPNYVAALGIGNGGTEPASLLEVGGAGHANYAAYFKGVTTDSTKWAAAFFNSAGSSIGAFRNDRLFAYYNSNSTSGLASFGASGTQRAAVTLFHGADGNKPAYMIIYSPNGTPWYLFVEDDGTVKVDNAIPAANTDGDVIGAQT